MGQALVELIPRACVPSARPASPLVRSAERQVCTIASGQSELGSGVRIARNYFNMKCTLLPILTAVTALSLLFDAAAADRKLIFIAGKPSHPPGMHEFRAGALLLQNCLTNLPGLQMLVYSNGWPESSSAFDAADAVVIYADGGGGHPALQGGRLPFLQGLINKGVGLGMMHYACEVPADKGGKEFLDWIGGHYEDKYSCNPMWTPEYNSFPDHPATRGVRPFNSTACL